MPKLGSPFGTRLIRFPRRGGNYNNTSNAGLGYVNCNNARSNANVNYGARPRSHSAVNLPSPQELSNSVAEQQTLPNGKVSSLKDLGRTRYAHEGELGGVCFLLAADNGQ